MPAHKSTNRAQILALLKRGNKSSKELAKIVDITLSAVNSHLFNLKIDKLAHKVDKIPGRFGGYYTIWAYGHEPEGHEFKPRRQNHMMGERTVVRKACKLAEVPKNDYSKGYGYILQAVAA